MANYEKIKVGDSAEIKHIVTNEDIKKFVELTGDDNRLHTDNEYAAETSFKKPVAHGMLGASFISTVIGTKLPGDGALWFSQSLEFLLPVRIGDELTIKVEVIKKLESLHAVELRTDVINQEKQKVITGAAKVKIIEKSQQQTEAKISEPKSNSKVALVVGGSGGIGNAVCIRLAEAGFNIAVHYNKNKEAAEKVKEKIIGKGRKAITVKADISSSSDVKEMMEQILRHLGEVTVLINCATTRIANVKFSDLEWSDIENHLNVGIKGIFNLVKSVIPSMEKNKYGKIINVTTQAIEDVPPSEWLPYVTAKSALYGFTKSLAVEYAPKGIRINMVSPGMTETDLITSFPEKTKLFVAAKTPLRRLAKPDDIAGAICFLASEKSDFITGETIRVNGGQTML